jgi:hypothetical protein
MKCKYLHLAVCQNTACPQHEKLVNPNICRVCENYSGPARGLGDRVKFVTDATGISAIARAVFSGDCGCHKRQLVLNEKFPTKSNGSIDGEPK